MAPPLIDTSIVPEVPTRLYALFDYGLTFFGSFLSEMNNIVGFFTCFFIGVITLIAGIYSVKVGHVHSVTITILSVLICIVATIILLFSIFAYFSVEGDGFGPLFFQN